VKSVVLDDGFPVQEVTVAVLDVLKGDEVGEVVFRIAGGDAADGSTITVPGAPAVQFLDRVLVQSVPTLGTPVQLLDWDEAILFRDGDCRAERQSDPGGPCAGL
jgi:hypothetical protein